MPNPFEKPFISKIDRDAELAIGTSINQGFPSIPEQLSINEKDRDVLVTDEEVEAEIRSPLIKKIRIIFNRLRIKADAIREEGSLLTKMHINALNHNTKGMPKHTKELVKNTTDQNIPDDKDIDLDPCTVDCIANAAGYTGNSNLLDTAFSQGNLNTAEETTEKIEKLLNRPFPNGWAMLLFLVRFILAFAVHMLVGFLTCFFKGQGKIVIPLGFTDINLTEYALSFPTLGDWISDTFFCPIERFLLELLKMGCKEKGDQPCQALIDNGALSGDFDSLKIFPCCECEDAKRPGGKGSGKPGKPRPFIESFGKELRDCVDAVISGYARQMDPDSDGGKVCRNCTGVPKYRSQSSEAAANEIMDWLINNSILTDNDGTNKNNPKKIFNAANLKQLRNDLANANMAEQTANRLEGTITENIALIKTENDEGCPVVGIGASDFLNKSFDELGPNDISRAMLANLDTDLAGFISKAQKRSLTDIQGGTGLIKPGVEPFDSIFGLINDIDKYLGEILDDTRKHVVRTKVFLNYLSSREFCCVLFTIAFLGNIIKYHKLCPEESIADLFNYTADLADSKSIQDILKFLKLFDDIIDALNEDLRLGIQITGLTLPFGTLVEILKQVVGQTVSALLSLAIAPIDRVLSELENSTDMKDILNNNCFGIADLLGMLKCGIGWILDLIAEAAAGLININAKNIEVIGDIKISNMRMSFLLNLSKLIKLLIDLLESLGDCYTPELLGELIATKAIEAEGEDINALADAIEEAGDDGTKFDGIGSNKPDIAGSTEDAITELDSIGESNGGFPIFPNELGSFKTVVEEANSLSMAKIIARRKEISNISDDINKSKENVIPIDITFIEELIGGRTDRVTIKNSLVNMVKELNSLSNK